MTIFYDPQIGYLATAINGFIHFRHTIFPYAIGRFEFWFFFLLHLTVFVSHKNGYLHHGHGNLNMLQIHWDYVLIIAGMTTIFNVFYTNQCFKRYMFLYVTIQTLKGNVLRFVFDVRLFLSQVDKAYANLLSRWCLACVAVFFLAAKDFYSAGNPVESLNLKDVWDAKLIMEEDHWRLIVSSGILNEREVRSLQGRSVPQIHLIIFSWCAKLCNEGVKRGQSNKNMAVPSNANKTFIWDILNVLQPMKDIMDALAFPMPFPYYHLLNVMMIINMALWAYSMGLSESFVSPFVFVCAAMIFMGTLELSAQLSNPFGDDDVDFQVGEWIVNISTMIQALREYEFTSASETNSMLKDEERLDVDMAYVSELLGGSEKVEKEKYPAQKPHRTFEILQSVGEASLRRQDAASRSRSRNSEDAIEEGTELIALLPKKSAGTVKTLNNYDKFLVEELEYNTVRAGQQGCSLFCAEMLSE